MTWKQEPYKSAKVLTGNKTTALILINLIGQVKEMGLIEYNKLTIIKQKS